MNLSLETIQKRLYWLDTNSWTQHKDGGWIYKDAVVNNRVKIFKGIAIGGEIHDGQVHGGVIHGGEIHSGAIHGGAIHGGIIRGGEIHGGAIHGGVIYGGEIHGGVIRGGVVDDGKIYESPIFIQGTKHFVTQVEKGKIQIGCEDRTIEDWLENYVSIFILEKYSHNQVWEYKKHIDYIISLSQVD